MLISFQLFHVPLRKEHVPLLNINNLIEHQHQTGHSETIIQFSETEQMTLLFSPSTDQKKGYEETPQETSIPLSWLVGGVLIFLFPRSFILALISPLHQSDLDLQS